MSIEDLEKSFTLKATGSNSFQWMCLQNGCFETMSLVYSIKSKSVNLYSAQRHVRDTCWLSGNKKPQFSTKKTANFFGTPLQKKNSAIASTKKMPHNPSIESAEDGAAKKEVIDVDVHSPATPKTIQYKTPKESNYIVPCGNTTSNVETERIDFESNSTTTPTAPTITTTTSASVSSLLLPSTSTQNIEPDTSDHLSLHSVSSSTTSKPATNSDSKNL